MSDNGATAVLPQTFVECGECGGNVNISWFCKNCPASLCDTCASDHKRKRGYKSHSVVQRTYTVLRLYGPAKIAEQCQIHPEKEISSYCNECNVPCCISCLAKDHQCHRFSTIEDKYFDAEKSLNDYARQLLTDVKPTLDRMEEQVKANAKEEKMHVQKVIKDINNFRKDVVQNFNWACDNLIVKVQNISQENGEGLREIEKSKQYLESLNREIEGKIQKGNLDLLKYVPPKFASLVPDLKNTSKFVPYFEPDQNILAVKNGSVGKIRFKEKVNEPDSSNSMRSVIVNKMKSFETEIEVSSIIKADKNRSWITSSSSTTIYLFDNMGKIVWSVKVEGGKGINNLVIARSGRMIVTCADKKVRFVSMSGKVSTVIDTAPFVCYGVCLTEKEEIVVCLGDQGDTNHVALYTHDGRSKLREIRYGEGKGKRLISNPYRVVQNGLDLCVVDDDHVVCVDKSGDVMWVYDGKQTKLDKLFYPHDICVDKYHNLLVTDNNNHCVHYIDREGELIQVILTRKQTGLQHHRLICVDDVTGQVWVGNYTGKVVIATY